MQFSLLMMRKGWTVLGGLHHVNIAGLLLVNVCVRKALEAFFFYSSSKLSKQSPLVALDRAQQKLMCVLVVNQSQS
jgi:hypothetical protein